MAIWRAQLMAIWRAQESDKANHDPFPLEKAVFSERRAGTGGECNRFSFTGPRS